MILVDTSVWIDLFRGRNTISTTAFRRVLDHGSAFGLASVIYQEVLQGAASDHDFGQLTRFLGSQRFYEPSDPKGSAEAAAWLYFRCRRQGVTIRSTIDCLIAQIAIEHDLWLLHDDRDFERLAEVEPGLRLYSKA